MNAKHHPDPASLMSYAAGGLGEPFAILVAAHAEACAACRAEIRDLGALGEALTRDCGEEPTSERELSSLLQRLDDAPAPSRLPPRPAQADALPEPLARLFGGQAIPWRTVAPGLETHRRAFPGGQALRFLRAAPGVVIPEHTHPANEMTLVLEGELEDVGQLLSAGDVCEHVDDLWHAPVARGDRPCLCVIAEEGAPIFAAEGRKG